ncbi:MAG: hypothetical protein IH851_05285 [Armatimonadetes bacterium]|nr:hypothetical protein [Armatimonadota bacterium]
MVPPDLLGARGLGAAFTGVDRCGFLGLGSDLFGAGLFCPPLLFDGAPLPCDMEPPDFFGACGFGLNFLGGAFGPDFLGAGLDLRGAGLDFLGASLGFFGAGLDLRGAGLDFLGARLGFFGAGLFLLSWLLAGEPLPFDLPSCGSAAPRLKTSATAAINTSNLFMMRLLPAGHFARRLLLLVYGTFRHFRSGIANLARFGTVRRYVHVPTMMRRLALARVSSRIGPSRA